MPHRYREVVAPIAPFVGIIESTHDALIIFEAARRAILPRITRRLLESEKFLITSGAVFVFDELESGIKRWTDGLVWSPSRILSNFIIYREANERTDRRPPRPRAKKGHQPLVPHVKSAAVSSSRVKVVYPDDMDADGSDIEEMVAITMSEEDEAMPGKKAKILRGPRPRRKTKTQIEDAGGVATQEDRERELVGSLTAESKYKPRGLIKKTISVSINGVAQHLVSYYNMEDALSGQLRTPSSFPELASLAIHPDLLANAQFRYAPKTEVDEDGTLQYLGEGDETMANTTSSIPVITTTPASRPRSPPRRDLRMASAEPVLIPVPDPNLLPVARAARKRSNTISTLDDVPPVVLVIQDGRPLAAEALRLNPPSDIILESTLLRGPHQLYPTLSPAPNGPTVFVSRPEPRRNFAFLLPAEQDHSIGGALTPRSALRSTMDSLASYEANGMHAGWQTGEGLENERIERKRKRDASDEEQSSPEWNRHQPPLLSVTYPPSSRPSFGSNSSVESFSHMSYRGPATPVSIQNLIHPPDSNFPFPGTRNDSNSSGDNSIVTPSDAEQPSSASSSSSNSLPFSRTNRPTFRAKSSFSELSPPLLPLPAPARPHPQSSSYFPFSNRHLNAPAWQEPQRRLAPMFAFTGPDLFKEKGLQSQQPQQQQDQQRFGGGWPGVNS